MKKVLPYKSTNNLANYLTMFKEKKQVEINKNSHLKYRYRMVDAEMELADFLNVTRANVILIKRQLIQPSLPIAMKICEFFQVSLEQMFSLHKNEEYYEMTVEKQTL